MLAEFFQAVQSGIDNLDVIYRAINLGHCPGQGLPDPGRSSDEPPVTLLPAPGFTGHLQPHRHSAINRKLAFEPIGMALAITPIPHGNDTVSQMLIEMYCDCFSDIGISG